jgi:hypothetical protein
MSMDIEKRLRKMEEFVVENNKMLHKIRRREIFNFWLGIIKLLIVLGVFYYGYKFFEPVVTQYFDIYKSLTETVNDAKEIKENFNIGLPKLNIN